MKHSPACFRQVSLEVELDAELQTAWVVELAVNDAEVLAVYVGVARIETHVVEGVEGLCAYVEPHIFGEAEGAGEREVLVDLRRGARLRVESRGVAQLARRLRREDRTIVETVAAAIIPVVVRNPSFVTRNGKRATAVEDGDSAASSVTNESERRAAGIEMDTGEAEAAEDL